MNGYYKLEKIKNDKKIKYTKIYNSLGITKQNFYHHLKNLKKGNITFNGNQIKIISEVTGIKINDFFY